MTNFSVLARKTGRSDRSVLRSRSWPTLVAAAASIFALCIASQHTLPIRDFVFSTHDCTEVLWAVAAFAFAGLCLTCAGASLLSSADVQVVGLLLGFYAIVVSATLPDVAANNVYLVLIGACAALVGGLLGACLIRIFARAFRSPKTAP